MGIKNENYEEKIKQEAGYWGKHYESEIKQGKLPDVRLREDISQKSHAMWDNPIINEITRGKELEFIITEASKNGGEQVLDLGCGMGALSLEIARRGMNVDGIDVSEKAIEIAKQYLMKQSSKEGFGRINYMVGDLNKVTLTPNTYDAVVCWDALHHILNLDHLIAEVKKSLKQGGEFIVLDHIGSQRKNLIFSFAISGILLLFPFYTQLTYKEKIKRILKILLKQSTEEERAKDNNFDISPFEDVSQDKIVKTIKRNFHIINYWTLLSFCSHNLTSINIKDRKLFYKTISFLKRMDDVLIQLHVLRGEYVFIDAEKR
jgi:2-polyprenyl-3-methyl-5-hydroxy-6-metoxy-1,4-benzoquinol methylase